MGTHINDLPDNVLSDILSRLPTVDAVRTSVLSKHWEFKWTLVYNVKIDDYDEEFSSDDFVDIAERTILHLQDARNYCLRCSDHFKGGLSRIETLLSAVFLRNNTESLELSISDFDEGLVLPRSLLNCTSLRKLKLMMNCTFKLPVRSSFPNLKTLSLDGVQILNGNSKTDMLILTFPVLETFDLSDCKWLEVKWVEMNAPSLTSFRCRTPPGRKGVDCTSPSMKILGSKSLAKFTLDGRSCGHVGLNGSTVEYAHLSFLFDYDGSYAEPGLRIRKLLRELSRAKCLLLTNVLSAVSGTQLGLPLSRFDRLIELRVEIDSGVEGLFELLHAAPFLKTLDIDVIYFDEYDYGLVNSLPSCVFQLEEIRFRYTDCDQTHQCHLEKFLLKNAVKVKRVYVYGPYQKQIVKKLSSFTKGSASVTISSKNKPLIDQFYIKNYGVYR